MPIHRNVYIVSGTEAFTKGGLDNVALTQNAVCLEQTAGRHVLYGCYTSPAVSFPAFDRLSVSWNAETPEKTVVEAQARIYTDDGWSAWFSFGKWSPHIPRAGVWQPAGAAAYMQGDTLYVCGRASQAQLRMYLYTEDERLTPVVRLLAASVRPAAWEKEPATPYARLLRIPAYSQKGRSPVLQESLNIPTALTGMMNRYWLDILPEETALAMYDHAAQNCSNLSFAAALAGSFGYSAWCAYLSPAGIWAHIKAGDTVAAAVRCRCEQPPQQADADAPDDLASQPAALVQLADGLTPGDELLMPVRGFEVENGETYVLVNDSMAPTDEQAQRRFPAQEFWRALTGPVLVVSQRNKNQNEGCPKRQHLPLKALAALGSYMFQTQEGEDFPLSQHFSGVIACAVPDETVHATTAHKHFSYAERTPEGGIRLDASLLAAGKKITVYAIFPSGNTLVGDVNAGG